MMQHYNRSWKVKQIIQVHVDVYVAAVGCAEPEVNPSMHYVKRTDREHVVVGCYSSQQTWELTCHYNTWEGTPGECNSGMGYSHYSLSNRPFTMLMSH